MSWSKSVKPFSRAKRTQAALSTATSALSAKVARRSGLAVTSFPYSHTCGQSASVSATGVVNVMPRARLSARCVSANMSALPPASEFEVKTRASLQRTLCVPRPMPCRPPVERRHAETIHSSVR